MSPSTSGGGPPDPAATRRRILAAAEACYLERGIAATTLSAVATRAGVSRPTVYKHFGAADGLAAALIQGELDRFFDRLAAEVAAAAGPRERLVGAVAFAVEYARDHRLLQRLLVLESEAVLTTFTTQAQPLLRRVVALLGPEVARARSLGAARAVDPEAAAEWCGRMAISLVLTPSVTRELADPAALRAHVADLLSGVLLPADAAGPATTGTR